MANPTATPTEQASSQDRKRYVLLEVTDGVHDLSDMLEDMRRLGGAQLTADGYTLDVKIHDGSPLYDDGFGRLVSAWRPGNDRHPWNIAGIRGGDPWSEQG
jgi:hypothetical protein